jgi:ESCRT-II complex subunit VPS22
VNPSLSLPPFPSLQEQFKATGEEVKQSNLVAMKEQLSTFKSNLEEFAHKYRSEIRSNPAFRAQFHTMCANIGVDPLSSNKGMWNELLGFGDFYYELGVQVSALIYPYIEIW